MNKKKIAVIGLKGLPAFGGAAAVGENIIEQLKDEYDFTVYSVASHTDCKTGDCGGFRQVVFSSIKNKKLNTLLYYLKAFMHVFFSSYSIVHLHHSDMALLVPLLKLRHKVVVTTHGAHNVGVTEKWRRYKWFFRSQMRLLRFADALNCVSQQEVRWLKDNYDVLGNYIPNGINIPKDLEMEKGAYLFFASGRIIPDKGCHTLIEALEKMNYKGRLLIAGDTSQMKEYSHTLQELSNGLDVEFLGMIKDKKVLLQYIASADLFVYPSEKEAMSMMLLEAASTSTPIVCSDIVENRDVFSDNEVLFFKNKSIDDLSNRLVFALDHNDEMLDKAQCALRTLQANHDWKHIAHLYAGIYHQLIA